MHILTFHVPNKHVRGIGGWCYSHLVSEGGIIHAALPSAHLRPPSGVRAVAVGSGPVRCLSTNQRSVPRSAVARFPEKDQIHGRDNGGYRSIAHEKREYKASGQRQRGI